MSTLIAVSGKGGVGKTVITALMLKAIIEEGIEDRAILVIDADPDANLADVLGIPFDVKKTLGYVATEFKKELERASISEVDKATVLQTQVLEVVQELPKFDFLVMWRTEGEGCYCFVNAVLSNVLEWLMDQYDIILADCEAGLEHFNRRVFKAIDYLVLVTDQSKASFDTVKRVLDVVHEVGIRVRNVGIVVNKFREHYRERVTKLASELGVEIWGFVPYSEVIEEFMSEARSLMELPGDEAAYVAVKEVLKKIGIL